MVSNQKQKVLKGSLIRLLGFLVGAALLFGGFVLIGRYLGVEDFGNFSIAFAVTELFANFIGMGILPTLIRDIAVDTQKFKVHAGVAKAFFVCLSIFTLLSVALAGVVIGFTDTFVAVLVVAATVVCAINGFANKAVLVAFERMRADVFGVLLQRSSFFSFLVVTVYFNFGILGALASLLISNAFQWMYYKYIVSRHFGRIPLIWEPHSWKKLLIKSLPLGITGLLRKSIKHIDKFLIAAFLNPFALGIFSASYKFLEAITPLAMNILLPVFPAISKIAQHSKSSFGSNYLLCLKYVMVLSVPLAVVMFTMAEVIVVFFFGDEFRESARVLRVLAPAFIFVFVAPLNFFAFTAMERQKEYMQCVAITFVVNLVLDLVLIPSYGYIGAAIASVAAEILLLLLCMYVLIVKAKMEHWKYFLATLFRPLLAAIVFGAICWSINGVSVWFIPLIISVAFAAYLVVLYAVGTFDATDIALLKSLSKRRMKES